MPYDIFRKSPNSPLVWLETAKDIDEMKGYLMKTALMKVPPADFDEYLVWDLENNKLIQPLPSQPNAIFVEAKRRN